MAASVDDAIERLRVATEEPTGENIAAAERAAAEAADRIYREAWTADRWTPAVTDLHEEANRAYTAAGVLRPESQPAGTGRDWPRNEGAPRPNPATLDDPAEEAWDRYAYLRSRLHADHYQTYDSMDDQSTLPPSATHGPDGQYHDRTVEAMRREGYTDDDFAFIERRASEIGAPMPSRTA